MSTPMSFPRFKGFDSNGVPLAGGKLYTYEAHTDTPLALYQDNLFATPHNVCIELDANGEALIYAKAPFKALLTDSDDVPIDGWPIDYLEIPPYHSYLVVGPTVPPTPAADTIAMYAVGTAITFKDSAGTITTPIASSGLQSQSYTAAAAGGSANAITATFNPVLTTLTDKLRVTVTSTATNTGAVTFAPDSLAPKPVLDGAGFALIRGAIPAANIPLALQYVLALDSWVLRDAYPGNYSALALLQNRQAQNTNGGTATSGSWLIIPLNTEQEDTAAIVDSSVLPAFTLQVGTYRFESFSPFFNCGKFQTRLYNVTDASVAITGSTGRSPSDIETLGQLCGTVIIAAAKQFRLEYQVETTQATSGLGVAGNFGTEVYAQLKIWKIA